MDINATIENAANNATNGTKIPDDPNSLYIAYAGLFTMALIPIYIGSFRALTTLFDQKKKGEDVETLTNKDAAKFPLIASLALFGMYIFFKVFSKEYINMLLSSYFFVLGVLAFAHTFNPLIEKFIPANFMNSKFTITAIENKPKKEEEGDTDEPKPTEHFKLDFEKKDFIGLAIGLAVGIWYISTKHWVANNIFGLAFSVNAIELLQLNKIATGCILLGGLFVYDIFWVFGTNVMVTVAKSFEAPIKVIFPRDILINGIASKNFSMLGLGDIVIPGIFVALLLRFDYSLNKQSRKYFISGFVAYIIGLATTMIVMHVFHAAQPALLYLVPTCLGIPIALSLVCGDSGKMFAYADKPETDETESLKKVE